MPKIPCQDPDADGRGLTLRGGAEVWRLDGALGCCSRLSKQQPDSIMAGTAVAARLGPPV